MIFISNEVNFVYDLSFGNFSICISTNRVGLILLIFAMYRGAEDACRRLTKLERGMTLVHVC